MESYIFPIVSISRLLGPVENSTEKSFSLYRFPFLLTRRNSRSISFQQPCLRLSTTHPSSSQIIISLPSSVKVQCFLDFRKCFSISQYLARVSYFSKAFQCDWPAWLKERWFVFIRISTADSQTLMFLCRRFFVNWRNILVSLLIQLFVSLYFREK